MTTQTDRELLELAALAAGLTGYVGESIAGLYFCVPANPSLPHSYPEIYDWLKDDGDSFRLAVKLGMRVYVYPGMGDDYSIAATGEGMARRSIREDHNDDPYGSTRRAIVRAAADIGRSMKEQGE